MGRSPEEGQGAGGQPGGVATDSQGASPGWDRPWLSLSLFRYGGCGGAPSLPPFDTVTSLGLAQLCEHILCKPQSRQLYKIQGPREQPQASQSAKALPMPLMLNLRPWRRSELTHRAGLRCTWLVSRTPITKQPAEESAGSFRTELDVGQDSRPRMCTQPWKSNV